MAPFSFSIITRPSPESRHPSSLPYDEPGPSLPRPADTMPVLSLHVDNRVLDSIWIGLVGLEFIIVFLVILVTLIRKFKRTKQNGQR